MQIDSTRTSCRLTYNVGLLTTNEALLSKTITDNNLKQGTRRDNFGQAFTVYSNEKFAFFLVAQNHSVVFDFLGKESYDEYMPDVTKIMSGLGISPSSNQTLFYNLELVVVITTNEFNFSQQFLSLVNTAVIQQQLHAKNLVLTGYKIQTVDNNLSEVLIDFLSHDKITCKLSGKFSDYTSFTRFINNLNHEYLEKLLNAFFKI